MNEKKPKCYECKYRGDIPGDAHSQCSHPKLGGVDANPLTHLLSIIGRGGPMPNPPFKVKGNSHGIKMGWFGWPYNFDPVWLEECEGFSQKDQKHRNSE